MYFQWASYTVIKFIKSNDNKGTSTLSSQIIKQKMKENEMNCL